MAYPGASAHAAWRQPRNRSSYWLLYLLVLGAVVCLPLSIRASGWVPEADRLVWAAAWGLAVGFVIAQARAPDWLTWLGSMILGLEYSLQFAGKLLPRVGVLLGDCGNAVTWLWRAIVLQQVASPYPYSRSATYIAEHVVQFSNDLYAWGQAVRTGAASEDITMLWIIVSLAVWLLAWHAGYELIRQRRPFSALVPLGVAIVANVSFTDVGMTYVHVYLAITLVTLVVANIDHLERLWQRLGLDFSVELRRDTLLAGGVIAAVVLIIALVFPYRPMGKVVWFFWDHVGPTMERLYDGLDKAFAGRDPVPEPTPDLSTAGLVGHSISGADGLGEDAVFVVAVSDPAPPSEHELIARSGSADISAFVPKRYWRERTFDVYTGSGWETSAQETTEHNANSAWTDTELQGDEVTQTFTMVNQTGVIAPAVNTPLRVEDQDYATVERGPGDLAALVVGAPSYTVVSIAPDPSQVTLQAAEGAYPEWVAETYLALPEIPDEVSDLAQQIVDEAGAVTRYDKAIAIQDYLRQFIYDLDVEPPEPGQDAVAYFLFDAQRGYCDYTATAMVVMLRSVGVAARYAQGFGQGVYDYDEGVYVVRDRNRHAWPEVYFPGSGWVEFEPTPIQSVWHRTSGALADTQGEAAAQAVDERHGLPPIVIWGAALAAVVVLVIVWPFKYLRPQSSEPRATVGRTYAQLERAARRIGLGPVDGQTPREYLRFLSAEVERRAPDQGQAAGEIATIAMAYQTAIYSRRPLSGAIADEAASAWTRLRLPLVRVWWARIRHPE